MKRNWIHVWILAIFLANILIACESPIEILPQNVTATASLIGTDGLGVEVDPVTLQLTHIPEEEPTSRVASTNDGPQNLTQVELLIERTGIPIGETYHFLQISQGTIHPEDNDPYIGVAGPGQYIEQNIGDLVELRVRTDLLDSPLSGEFSDFPPPATVPDSGLTPVRKTGYSFLARVEEDDVIIPFNAPNQLIDMNRLINDLFIGLGEAIQEGVTSDTRIVFGGPNGDGDFRMYFIPHVTHTGLTEGGRNFKGFGFIIAFTVNVLDPALNFIPIGSARVFVPVSLLFAPEQVTGGMTYDIRMDPFSLTGGEYQPENLERITVYARSLLADFTNSYVAEQVRTGMIDALSDLPDENLEAIDDQLDWMSVSLGSFLSLNRTIPDNFDIVLLPEGPLRDSTVLNRVAPFDEDSISVQLAILE